MENAIQAAKAELYRQDILKNGNIQITVMGNSMFPFLKNNDVIVLQGSSLESIDVGDIVLTYNKSRMLCHRVFKKNRTGFQTKADALIYPDPSAKEIDLVAKVVGRKNGKKIVKLNTYSARLIGFFISRLMIVGAFFYIPLRLLRKIIRLLFSFLPFQKQL